jgi:hypothetical protein
VLKNGVDLYNIFFFIFRQSLLNPLLCRFQFLSCVSVRRPSVSFSHLISSSLKPQNRIEPNLPQMFIGWSSTRFLFLVLILNSTWLPGSIMCSHKSKADLTNVVHIYIYIYTYYTLIKSADKAKLYH